MKNLLRKPQASLAQLQDEALEILYAVCPEAVLHGGTAIWRCYEGKRFSEDLDFYALPKDGLQDVLIAEASKRSLKVTKFRKTQNSIYAKISDERLEVSIEVSLREKKSKIIAGFERSDGSHTDIYTLSPQDLIVEKANAFASRRLIRDIYDVYFLSSKYDLSKVRTELLKFVQKLPSPVDEKNLRTLVYAGPAPSFNEMVDAIKRRLGK
ncbi:MAG TPA: nucleotidyl transferase AbiEii/AbiGii toxin family protein [archaeon]|nr:nucleotidyl transferase AbiEii/AbiGii toxin family protein [archaeon]